MKYLVGHAFQAWWKKSILRSMSAHTKELEICLIAIQTVFIGFGLLALHHSSSQLEQTRRQIQGATIQEVFKTSKDILLAGLQNEAVVELFGGPEKGAQRTAIQEHFIGLLVNHYSTIFRQHTLHNIPDEYWHDVEKDLRVFFGGFLPNARWQRMRRFYSDDFVTYVDAVYAERIRKGGTP